MRFLRRSGSRHDLPLSMVGVRLGDRVLQIGCSDPGLFAAMAAKVGLTGRACAVDQDEKAAARARDAAAKGGSLAEVEVTSYRNLPFDTDAFDIVVIQQPLGAAPPDARVGLLQESRRVLRPGGRLIVIEGMRRGGLLGLLTSAREDPHYTAAGGTEGALRAEQFRAVRVLAERQGLRFIEGVWR